MKRRHLHIDRVIFVGKEANNIDDQPLDVWQAQVFVNKQEIMDNDTGINSEMGRKVGIAYRDTLKRIRDKIRRTGYINLNAKFMRELADKLV